MTLDYMRWNVTVEHSMMIDKALTHNAACIACLPGDPAPYLQKQKDLITVLGRMDRQLSEMEAASDNRSVTAKIAELARQSSIILANMRESLMSNR